MTKRRDALKAISSLAGVGAIGSGVGLGLADEIDDDNRREDGLTLVDDGEAQVPIVIDDDPLETVEEAVEELNYWLEQITGTGLEVLTYSEWEDRTPGRGSGSGSSRGLGCERGKGKGRGQLQVVAVGESPLTEELGVSVDHLEEDGAKVLSTNCELVLVGRDDPPHPDATWRGSYYAVLEFVNSLGVRQIWPGELGEVYPEESTLTVEPDEWEWESPLPFAAALRGRRHDSWKSNLNGTLTGLGEDPLDLDRWDQHRTEYFQWIRRHRASPRLPGRREKPSGNFYGHAFGNWYDEYAEEHPEWFAQPPEGRGVPSGHLTKFNKPNPEVQDEVFEDWHEDYQGDPYLHTTLNACQNDGPWHDTRQTSRDWDEGRTDGLPDELIWDGHRADDELLSEYGLPDVTERFVRFWNILADKVAEVDPELNVSGYAYLTTLEPPTHNEVRSNVTVGIVDKADPYPDNEALMERWNGWADAGTEQTFWRPNLFGLGHGLPYVYAEQLAEDLDQLHDLGNIGVDIGAHGSIGNFGAQGPTYYVLGQKFHRPEASAEEILAEFYDAFGPAADAVQEYFEFWEDLTISEGPKTYREMRDMLEGTRTQWTHYDSTLAMPHLFTPDVLDEGESLLEAAEDAVENADDIHQERVDFVRDGFEHSRLTVEFFRKAFEWYENPNETTKQDARNAGEVLFQFRQDIHFSHVSWAHEWTHREEGLFSLWSFALGQQDSLSGIPDGYADPGTPEAGLNGFMLEDWADGSFSARDNFTETPYAYDEPESSEWTTQTRDSWTPYREATGDGSSVEGDRLVMAPVTAGNSGELRTAHGGDKSTGTWELTFQYDESPSAGRFEYQFLREDWNHKWYVEVNSSGRLSLHRQVAGEGTDLVLDGSWDVDTEEHTMVVTRTDEGLFELFFDGEHVGEYEDAFLPSAGETSLYTAHHNAAVEIVEIRSY